MDPEPRDERMPRKLVFVAEAEDRDCRSTKNLIEELGYEVIALADVEAAIAVFPYSRADLVLTAFPLPLPDQPEREFAAHVRREAPRTLILGIVGRVADARKAMLAGCDGFLARPLDPEVVRVQLAQMIGPARDWPTLEP